MIHSLCFFDYSLKENIKATWALLKLKATPKRYTDINPDDLLALIESNQPLTVIDCRRRDTYERIGHIEGALSYPVMSFEDDIHTIPKDTQVVTVCYFGFFCQIAAQKLAKHGHKDVLSMTGGMEKWIMSDKPITKSAPLP